MKKYTIKNVLALSLIAMLAFSCKSKDKHKDDNGSTDTTEQIDSSQITVPATNTEDAPKPAGAPFDLNSIPLTDKLTGNFPYFKLPPGYHFTDPNSSTGTGEAKDYDKEYFYNHGVYVPQEGKTFKAGITNDEKKSFSKLELKKSFDDFIATLGGVNINNGETLKEGEVDRLQKLDRNAYSDGYLFSCNNWDDVHTYVLRTKDKTVWVQVNFGNGNGYLTVLETKPFDNQMSQTSAAVIKKEIDRDGKAVLHINFDVDRALLLPDGEKAVDEIAQVLKGDQNLNLSIEGHTDDSGNREHNRQLSIARANSVKTALVNSGINDHRLKTAGYGAEKPVAPNDSEENKAKNRRVELVKI